ncbi:hypothetical protein [Micromonospora siamensis]|uniref:Uncharacterized protein n=1 Tax=Micromonospora siamensis TaxID=299152 RepID=A0A1C5HIE3_9ACTN|nr:hypothetical protein [Micromonospora siamensis]SCG45770.1 hypothetical protein GA0074704_1789 [Micromonospora siamensis]
MWRLRGPDPCDMDRPLSWDERSPHRFNRESRTAPSQLPVPHPHRWLTAALVTSLAALVALTILASTGDTSKPTPLGRPGSDLDATVAFLGRLFRRTMEGVAIPFAADKAVWQRLVASFVLVVTFMVWRRWRQDSWVYRPGPVDVQEFDNGTGEPDNQRTYLRSRFCRQIAETSVYPPYAGPSDPPPQGFFDVLGQGGGNLLDPGVLMKLMGRLWPKKAYQIKGTLQMRTQKPQYGLSVTVTSLVGASGSATTTEWGYSWEDATCKAAYWAMAKIVPVTQLANTPPWRKWRGRDMPAQLFETYNEAKKRHDAQQLDDALWWYREALLLDPFNIDIRLMVGSVQEDLGLFLDALETYQGALGIVELEGRYTGALWSRKRQRLLHPLRYAATTWRLSRRHPEWVKLRLQYARALGYADRVVDDLFPPGPPPVVFQPDETHSGREKARAQNRERLCAAMAERYWPAVLDRTADGIRDQAKSTVRRMLNDPRSARVLLLLASWQEAHRLYEDARLVRVLRLGGETGVSWRRLRMLRDVWVPLRFMHALFRQRRDEETDEWRTPPEMVFTLADAGCLSAWWVWGRRRKAARALAVGWPASPNLLDYVVGRAQRRRNRLIPLDYLDYYAAGCVSAFALCGYTTVSDRSRALGPCVRDSAPQPDVEALTYRAVESLRAALMRTESGLAGRLGVQSDTKSGTASRLRTWIASSDPDLARLRNHVEFRFFQQDAYQPMKPVLLRPEDVSRVRVAAYTKRLLVEGARLLESNWHCRRDKGSKMDFHEFRRLVRLDTDTWRVVQRIAQDGGLFWEDRAEFGRLVTQAARLVTTAEKHFPPPIAIYDDLVIDGLDALRDDRPDLAVRVGELTGDEVEDILDQLRVRGSAIAAIGRRRDEATTEYLRGRDVRDEPFSADDYSRLCMLYAGSWQELVDLLRDVGMNVRSVDPADEQTEP